MKKTITTIILLAAIALNAFAQQYDPESDFAVEVIDNGRSVRITAYNGNNTVVRIPQRIQNLPVTEIGEEAFAEKRLVSVAIPNGVIVIGDYAFCDNQLTSITIPNSVTAIGSGAFAENRLTGASIQNSSVVIAPNAFWGNYNLTGLTAANTTRTLNQWPDLARYRDIVWREINDYGGSVRYNDAEINRLHASLGGDLNIADTPLEGALAGYFRSNASQLNDAAEYILPHSNPRQVDLQLGVFVYAGLVLNRYLNNAAITASHEAMLNFIAGRGNATRAEIEAHYRNGIGSLISGMVDTELWTVRFDIPIPRGGITRNGITRASVL